MPSTAKTRGKNAGRRKPAVVRQADLKRKLHELANNLQAGALARHFIPVAPDTADALKALTTAGTAARKTLFDMVHLLEPRIRPAKSGRH